MSFVFPSQPSSTSKTTLYSQLWLIHRSHSLNSCCSAFRYAVGVHSFSVLVPLVLPKWPLYANFPLNVKHIWESFHEEQEVMWEENFLKSIIPYWFALIQTSDTYFVIHDRQVFQLQVTFACMKGTVHIWMYLSFSLHSNQFESLK